MEKEKEKVTLITAREIKQKVGMIGKAMNEDNIAKDSYVMLCVQKGAAPFCADLQRELDGDVMVKNIKVKSYEGTETNGKPAVIEMEDLHDIKDKIVIITEDIIDTGKTLQFLTNYLKQYEPKEIKIAVLLDKKEKRDKEITLKPDYTGFVIPNYFVIGYGLDYDEKFRNLRDIKIITKRLSLLERFKIRREIKKQMNSPVRTNTNPKSNEIRKACHNEMTNSIGRELHKIDTSKKKPEGIDNTLLEVAKEVNDSENRHFIASLCGISNLALITFTGPYLKETYRLTPLRSIAAISTAALSFLLISKNKIQAAEEKDMLGYTVGTLKRKCGLYSSISEEENEAHLNHLARERQQAIKKLEKIRFSNKKREK